MINWLTLSVELSTEHLCGDGHLEHIASELAMRMRVVNVCSALKDLSKSNITQLDIIIVD